MTFLLARTDNESFFSAIHPLPSMLETIKDIVTALVDSVNLRVPGGRWQLFEFCDLRIVPDAVKHCAQNMLTAHWTKRLPILQTRPPAALASDAIASALDSIKDADHSDWTVIDFCSGAGGPVPLIESLVNNRRRASGKKPINFRLSDIYPNLDAWMEHAAQSDHLSFVPQPVDASNPPFSVISVSTAGDKDAVFDQGYESDGSKVFRLFCLAFHHFDDDMAQRVLKSTLQTSDAFAIIELQDRRVGSLLIMILDFWLLLLVTIFYFRHNSLHLLLTYAIPLLPFLHSWDGFVSCLRTRTFAEFMSLVERVQGNCKGDHISRRGDAVAAHGDWLFSHSRRLHTWPLGYMEVTFGRKIGTIDR
ncbi:hypothetical protein D0859_01397 [Hortaea werneckii]|uniref:Methyltransferase domain-containing protein n=1 Tax=Hortaea werneckii TaxID=91943 RepID=A0A3M7J9J6_HORWE|nr:hypothetical protein D0859_01397 [Hortaea werneckii]